MNLCSKDAWYQGFTMYFGLTIRVTASFASGVIIKDRSSMGGEKQVSFYDVYPANLYAHEERHETIQMSIAKAATQNLIIEGTDIYNVC